MDLFDLNASISLDTSKFTAGIDSAMAKLTELVSCMTEAGMPSEELENSIDSLGTITESSSDEMASLSSVIEGYTEVVVDSADESNDFSEALETSQEESEALEKVLDDLADQLGDTTSETSQLVTEVEDISGAFEDATDSSDDSTSSLSDLASAAADAASALGDVSSSQSDTGNETEETTKKTEEQSESLGETLVSAAEDAIKALGSGEGLSGALEALTGNFGTFGEKLSDAIEKLGEMISETAQAGDNIDKSAQKIGISTTAYQQWDAALQHSGSSAKSLKSVIKNLTSEVEDGNTAFEELGFSMEEVAEWDNEELLKNTIEALADMTDETERDAAAQELLGGRYQELLPLLNSGSEAIEDMLQNAEELGIFTEEEVANSAAYQDALQDFKQTIDEIENNIAGIFIPLVTDVMEAVTPILAFIGDITEAVETFTFKVEDAISGLVGDMSNPESQGWFQTLDEETKELISSSYEAANEINEDIDETEENAEEAAETIEETTEDSKVSFTDMETLVGQVAMNVGDTINSSSEDYNSAMNFVLDAMNTAYDEGSTTLGEAAGLTAEKLQEMSDSYHDTYDQIDSTLSGIISLYDSVEEVSVTDTQTMTDTLKEQEDYFEEYDQALSDLMTRTEDIEGFDALIAAINDGSPTAKATIEEWTGANIEDLTALSEQYAATQEAEENLTNSITEQKTGVTAGTVELVDGVIAELERLETEYGDAGSDALQGLINSLSDSEKNAEAAQASAETADETAQSMEEAFEENSPSKRTQRIGEYALEGLANGLGEFETYVQPVLDSTTTAIITWLTNFESSIAESMSGLTSPLTDLFDTETVGALYDEYYGYLEGKWEEFYAALQSWVTQLTSYFTSQRELEYSNFTAWVLQVENYITTEEAAIQTGVTTFISEIETQIATAEDNFVLNLETTLEEAKTPLDDFYTYVKDDLGTKLTDEFEDIGKNSVDAMKTGMQSEFPSLYSYIYDSVSEMVTTAKEALVVGSPSKKFMEIGRFTVEGFEVGWADRIGKARDKVAKDMDLASIIDKDGVLNRRNFRKFHDDFWEGGGIFSMLSPEDSDYDDIPDEIESIFEPLIEMFSLDSLSEDFEKTMEFLSDSYETFYEQLSEWVLELSEYWTEQGTLAYTNFTTWVTSILTYIDEQEVILTEDIETFIEEIDEKITEAESEFLTAFETTLDSALELLDEFTEEVNTWADELINQFYEIGVNSIEALEQGMESRFPELYDYIYESMQDMVSTAASALEIGSPSKKFMELGEYTAEGFGLGWKNEFSAVKSQISDDLNFATTSIDTGSSVFGKAAKAGKGITVVQNIYSQAQNAADLLREARWQQERAVMTGV